MGKKEAPPTRSFVGLLFRKLAREIDAKVVVEPTWKTVGQITFKDGSRRYFRYSSVDLNPLGSSEISKDKDYAAFFLRSMGYPTVMGKSFYSPRWCKAIHSRQDSKAAAKYAKKIGYPVIVKPNSASQGKGVHCVTNHIELAGALKEIFAYDDVALVQRPLVGKDYRIVILDGGVISAYERIPLNVTGDGRSSTLRLLQKKQREFTDAGRDTKIDFDDPRIKNKIKRQGLTLRSILERGRSIYLLDNANLSTGGDALDVTDTMHSAWGELSAQVTKDMGLRLCGVDIIIDGDISLPPKKYWILETNAAPGLDHYLRTGSAQKKIVEDLYRRVLRALAKH